jgi:hypothetical protein
MRTQWLRQNWLCALFAVLLICAFSGTAQSQNLVKGANMEDESAWNITYYNADSQPSYEFNHTGDTQRFGRGNNLYIYQDETAGQLLIWQRIKLIAGETYRATGAIKCLNYQPGPAGGGAWYQLYVDPEMPDPTLTDYNPGAIKFFDMDGWTLIPPFPEEFDGLWEVISQGGGAASAPYYTAPGTPGEVVEVTFGIKFGQWWGDYAGTAFELVVDELGLYALGSNELVSGDMESEDGWDVVYYNADNQPGYEFGFKPDVLKFGLGNCLDVVLDNSAGGQLLFYQRITCVAGETYRATGVISVVDYYSDFDPVNQGPWYQFYVTTEEPDPAAGDFNPTTAKMFDISAWDTDCMMIDFEQFQGLWEDVACLSELEGAPYFVAPGNPGETVEVTVGIKFGIYGPSEASFEVLADEIGFYRWSYGGVPGAVAEKTNPALPNEFVLDQNYPNPFNPTTTISFNLAKSDMTSLKVFNTTGALVATLVNGKMEAGRHQVSLAVNDLPSGVYYYQLQQNAFSAVKKCVILK